MAEALVLTPPGYRDIGLDHWWLASSGKCDPIGYDLADRHYSRRTALWLPRRRKDRERDSIYGEHRGHRAMSEDEYRDDDDGYCITCGGDGWLVVCPDDLCHGQGWCMHGDGDRPCPDCNDDQMREPWPESLPRYAIENGWRPAR